MTRPSELNPHGRQRDQVDHAGHHRALHMRRTRTPRGRMVSCRSQASDACWWQELVVGERRAIPVPAHARDAGLMGPRQDRHMVIRSPRSGERGFTVNSPRPAGGSESDMLNEDRSIDTNTVSEGVDDTDGQTFAARSAGEDGDLGAGAEDALLTSRRRVDGEGAPRKRGRPGKLTAETQANICAVIVAGLGVEHAAASAGVSAAAYHSWINTGRRVAARGADAEELSEHDERCLEFYWAVKRAKAESVAVVQRLVLDAATDHVVRKTVHPRRQLTNAHGFVCDDDGKPSWVHSISEAETRGPNLPALLAVLKQRSEELLSDCPPNQTVDANTDDPLADPTIRRLASIRVSREQLEAEAAYDRAEETGPETSPTTAVIPLTTDDYGPNYIYAFWESSLYAEVGPETPETLQTPTPEEST